MPHADIDKIMDKLMDEIDRVDASCVLHCGPVIIHSKLRRARNIDVNTISDELKQHIHLGYLMAFTALEDAGFITLTDIEREGNQTDLDKYNSLLES